MREWLFQSGIGGSVRVIEALLASGPTLLVGLMIAAVFRFYLGAQGTRRLFGGDSLRALPQSWAIGMLLPVCSIGVLPILMEMRRSRISPGALTAFALSAPLFNPLSLLYGLTLSRPYVIMMFALGSLVVVTTVGLIWDRIAKQKDSDSNHAVTQDLIGIHRLFAAVVYVCRQLLGPAGVWAIIATVGMFVLAAALPWGALQHHVNRDDWWAPARMACVAVPAYATPMLAMSQLGMMFQHANSPGAAFILLVVGAGLNLGTLVWLGFNYGFRSVTIWFCCLMTVVVALAYGVNKPLIPPGVEPAEHTHAFDIYTNPIHHLDSASGTFAIEKLKEKFGIVEQITVGIFAVIALAGCVFRIAGVDVDRIASRASKKAAQTEVQGFDRIVSQQTVGGTLLVGMVALSIVMCFAYYPSPEECLEEVRFIRADVLTAAMSGDADHAKFWIPRWDEWSRRLEVGTFIRRGRVTPYQRMQGYIIRRKLEILEHELEHEHDPELEYESEHESEQEHEDHPRMRELIADLMATNSRWVRAFRDVPVDENEPEVESVPVAVITPDEDTQHNHRHIHATDQSHDHSHEEFSGAHDHDHLHPHRHQAAPHGGRVENLSHRRHETGAPNLHLEVMPIHDRQITVYVLREQLGVLRTITTQPGELSLRLKPAPENSADAPIAVALQWNETESAYVASIPDSTESSMRFVATAELMVSQDDASAPRSAFVSQQEIPLEFKHE